VAIQRGSNLTIALIHRHLYGPPSVRCGYVPRDPVAAADQCRCTPPPHERPRERDTCTLTGPLTGPFTGRGDAWPFETPLPAGLPRRDQGYADRTAPLSAVPLEGPRRLPDKRIFSTTDIRAQSPPYVLAEGITGRFIDVFV
jgi:hypothetical protein